MSFHALEFKDRFSAMGDEAEAVFVELQDAGVVRYGLERPPINMGSLPQFLRYTPDFLQSARLVECQGMGRDQILKLKLTKWMALQEWDCIHPVWLFVWDSHMQRHTEATVDKIRLGWLRDERVTIDKFHDGPEYYAIPAEVVFGETPD